MLRGQILILKGLAIFYLWKVYFGFAGLEKSLRLIDFYGKCLTTLNNLEVQGYNVINYILMKNQNQFM